MLKSKKKWRLKVGMGRWFSPAKKLTGKLNFSTSKILTDNLQFRRLKFGGENSPPNFKISKLKILIFEICSETRGIKLEVKDTVTNLKKFKVFSKIK